MLRHSIIIMKRELQRYLKTYVAYIVVASFLLLNIGLTFYAENFDGYHRDILQSFFFWHSWIYLLLAPIVSMHLWSEENKAGTMELLVTTPITSQEVVLGKYCASYALLSLALLLTLPIWAFANYIWTVDNMAILLSYLSSFIIAGSFTAICICVSFCIRNQAIAFLASIAACAICNLSITPDFINISNLICFLALILCGIYTNIFMLEKNREATF